MIKEEHLVEYSFILLDLERKFHILDTAYPNYAIRDGANIMIHWIDNGDNPVLTVPYRSPLFLKTDTAKSYYIRFTNGNECCVKEYNDQYKKDEYLYYSKSIDGKLIECGLVKGDTFVPFKQFEDNDLMTEYIYGFNNDTNSIDTSTKTQVYHGGYINNPKKHYPRANEKQSLTSPKSTIKSEYVPNAISNSPPVKPPKPSKDTENKQIDGNDSVNQRNVGDGNAMSARNQSKSSIKPEPATKTTTTTTKTTNPTDFFTKPQQTHDRKNVERQSNSVIDSKQSNHTQQRVDNDEWFLSNGDTIQENTQYSASTLEFKAFYKDDLLTTLVINMLNFPSLKHLIIGNYVQSLVKGVILQISDCSLLETIKFGMRSFTYYQSFVFTSMICYFYVVYRFTKTKINRNEPFINGRTYQRI